MKKSGTQVFASAKSSMVGNDKREIVFGNIEVCTTSTRYIASILSTSAHTNLFFTRVLYYLYNL